MKEVDPCISGSTLSDVHSNGSESTYVLKTVCTRMKATKIIAGSKCSGLNKTQTLSVCGSSGLRSKTTK